MKELLISMTQRKIHMVPSNFENIEQLLSLITELNETIKNPDDENNSILISNIKFLDKNITYEINSSVEILVDYIPRKYKQHAFNISKLSILTFNIGRFYCKTKYFESPTFFDDYKNFNKFQLFQEDDFISLVSFPKTIHLVLYKKTNQLFIKKKL